MFVNYDEGINTYGCTVTADWDYTQERPYKGDVIRDKRKLYIHYYYSIDKGADDEKVFGNLKERLNMRRLLVSYEKGLDGKIFVEFIALILVSYLDHKMKETDLYKNYILRQLLDKLDVIECFEDASHSLRIGEIINKQVEIHEALGVEVPTSS